MHDHTNGKEPYKNLLPKPITKTSGMYRGPLAHRKVGEIQRSELKPQGDVEMRSDENLIVLPCIKEEY